jgi:hypothetical protein
MARMPQQDQIMGRITRLTMLACCAAGVPVLTAQVKPSAAIPATAPTQSVSDLPSAHPAVTETTPRGHAKIVWNGAQVTIEAGGSALPEILQKIARETGMKITGGVPDERVFGTYGPGPVQSVMGELFEGLAVNMMLINGSATAPKELVLTARTGAASPPQVRQVSGDSDESSTPMSFPVPPSQQPRRSYGPSQPQRSENPGALNGTRAPQLSDAYAGEPMPPDTALNPPEDNASTSGEPMENNQPAENSAPPPSAEDQSSNGNRTPEQIFEELRRRQQEQQQATPTE